MFASAEEFAVGPYPLTIQLMVLRFVFVACDAFPSTRIEIFAFFYVRVVDCPAR